MTINYINIKFHPHNYTNLQSLDDFYEDTYHQFMEQHSMEKISIVTMIQIKELAEAGRFFFTSAISKNLEKVLDTIDFKRQRSKKYKNNGRIIVLNKYEYLLGRKKNSNLTARVVRLRDKVDRPQFKKYFLIHFYNQVEELQDFNNNNNNNNKDQMGEEYEEINHKPQFQPKKENQNNEHPQQNDFESEDDDNSLPNQPQPNSKQQQDEFFEKMKFQKVKVEQDSIPQQHLEKEQLIKIIEEKNREIAQQRKELLEKKDEIFNITKQKQDLEIQIRCQQIDNTNLTNYLRQLEINVIKQNQKLQEQERLLEQEKKTIRIDDD